VHGGIGSLKDILKYEKANPGKLRSASASTTNALYMATIAKALNVTIEDIKYKTTDQAIVSMLQNDTQLAFNAASGFTSQIDDGKLVAIASLSPQPTQVFPSVPTMTEQGVPLVARFTNGVWAPQDTPAEVISRLNGAIAAVLKQPSMIERQRSASLTPTASTPASCSMISGSR